MSSPAASYSYDSGSNGIGRRTGMSDGSGSSSWSYDALGRTTSESHTIGSVTKSVSYGYNQAGELTSLTYPSGHVVSYAYSSAGRPTSAVNGTSIYYVTSATYTPGGAVMGYHNGSSITVSNTYNNRLQPDVLKAYVSTASPPDIYGFDYNFVDGSGHNNGNVQQIVNLKDSNYTQNFTYDELNRIQQGYSSGSSWGETFTIDPWGNLTNRGGVSGKTYYEPLNAAPATGTNQLNGYSYDAAGNLTNDGTSYSYDAESRLSSTAGYTYTYDGDGQRVKKANSSTGTLYWMGSGNVLGESDLSGSMQYEYVFFNGKRVARRDISTGNVHYYFSDHLGSSSVITSDTGTIQKESAYYPYGGEISITGSDSNHYKFTGKERDSESGLDYFGARYHGSSIGRWMSPDADDSAQALPYSDLDDPQTLNLYSYVRNSPLSLIDPDGHMQCRPDPSDPGTIICEPDPPPKKDPPKPPPVDPCGFLCQEVFHGAQSQRTWDISAQVTNEYIATPLLTFLLFAVPGALEAAGPTMETSLGTAIVSGATKAAAKQAAENAAMSAAQKAAVKHAIARATAKESVSIERLADGSIRVLKSRPGFDGRQVISTIIKESGKSNTVQVGVSATGEVTHYHPK